MNLIFVIMSLYLLKAGLTVKRRMLLGEPVLFPCLFMPRKDDTTAFCSPVFACQGEITALNLDPSATTNDKYWGQTIV